jgi:hypothetical protein
LGDESLGRLVTTTAHCAEERCKRNYDTHGNSPTVIKMQNAPLPGRSLPVVRELSIGWSQTVAARFHVHP